MPVWKAVGPTAENRPGAVEKPLVSVEEWRAGCGSPVQEPVENRRATVDALWKPCGREGVSGRGLERVRRASDVVLVGAVVASSVAIACAALLAWAAGSLGPAVGAVSLLAGVVGGALAARSALRVPLDPPKGGAGVWDGLALAAFAAVSIRQFGWLVFERGGALLTLVPYNYGDLPLHWTYVQHLAGGASFWPENPILAGERLRYPFGVDLLTAIFVQLGASLPVLLVAMGLLRGGPRRPRPAALGRGARRRGVRLRGRPRGLPAALDRARRGLPVGRRLEEPVPGALRAAARVSPRAPRGPPSPLVLASAPAAGRGGARALGRGGALGHDAPRAPPHVPLRLAPGGGVGDRRPARARGSPDPGLGPRPRRLVGLPGHGRLPRRVARRLEAGLDDGRPEPRRLPPPELRPLPAPGARRPRRRGAGASPRGAPRPRAGPRRSSRRSSSSASRPGSGTTRR